MSGDGQPTRKEMRAKREAEESAGGPAPPRLAGQGFGALVGQETVVTSLRRALGASRLPHALLFHGPRGVGKASCAGLLAQALNCSDTDFVDACGSCVSCRKVVRGLHPDIVWIEPDGAYIKVDQVREVVEAVSYRPYEGRRRVVILDEAHRMNASAQNALLKTLEEPPASSVLVLVTPAPSSLLPTVRSRCQHLRFQPLPLRDLGRHLEEVMEVGPEEARLRAALSSGSVGLALEIDLDTWRERRDAARAAIRGAHRGGAELIAAAEELLATGSGQRRLEQAGSAMEAVRDVLRDLLVLRLDGDDALLVDAARRGEWTDWAHQFEPEDLVAALGAVQRADERIHGTVPPNARLVVEQGLLEAGAALRGQRGGTR